MHVDTTTELRRVFFWAIKKTKKRECEVRECLLTQTSH